MVTASDVEAPPMSETLCAIKHVPAKHALGLDPRVETGSPTRTCVNCGIYGVSRSYGITE
jgi:hypothetical protein